MEENVEVLIHSSIRITGEKTIYIDPFKISQAWNDADYIFVTHDHYDHYSEADIDKVKNENTIYIVPESLTNKLLAKGIASKKVISVKPNCNYTVGTISFETVPAYNINKPFHPKENGWVGYVIDVNNLRYYIAGDTDITEENKKVKCDVALVPVGGTYTMNAKEAAELVNTIKPKVAIPIHYGDIVGTKKDAQDFLNLIDLNK
ncbi:MAG: MBL fold metallo-hydrolase [Clostridia bacterium]|nr:MBL fold metallo-hydrolase [Clostridia bacterium]